MPNELLLIKLLIAHLIGDFILQPDKWVAEKEARKIRSAKLYYHALIHGGLYLLFGGLSFWPNALILMLIHWSIDLLKLYLQKTKTRRIWFFADQALHLASIFILCLVLDRSNYLVLGLSVNLNYALVILFLSYPSSVIIRVLIAKWTPTAISGKSSVPSLESAGKYIGIMERLLIFVFIVTNHFDAVGFLLAAKSIFRFGDLREGNDLKLTEYILIGTLLSFGLAIVVSLLVGHPAQ